MTYSVTCAWDDKKLEGRNHPLVTLPGSKILNE